MNRRKQICISFAFGGMVAVFGTGAFATIATASGSLVKNGDFATWTDEAPDGWQIEIGAKNGAGSPVSEVKRIAGPALMLRGDAKTMAWRTVSQTLDVEVGKTYRLEFDARSKDIKREGRQYNNCHVALMSTDPAGKVVGRSVQDVSEGTADWKHFSVNYAVPENASKTVVYVFLSKSGLIGVKGVQVVEADTESPPGKIDANNLAKNGGLNDWKNGLPVHWTAEVAAMNGSKQPESEITALADAGAELSGNSRTMAWRSLSQDVSLRPTASYVLSFQASAGKVKREGRQYDNCYVGVMHFDAGGKRLDMATKDLSRVTNWKRQTIRFETPAATKKSTLLIFLSKSGSLKVKDVLLKEATPERPFR